MALSKDYKMNDITWHEKGPCIIKGHPREHVLELDCLSAMRNWLYPNKTLENFLKAVDKKRG